MERRKALITLSSILILLAAVCSCKANVEPTNQNSAETAKVLVHFKTRLPGGATFESSRSATPAFGGNTISYDITATPKTGNTAATVVREGISGAETGNTDFSLPLEPGEWTVSVKGYQKDDSEKKTLFTGSIDITVNADISQNNSFSIQLSVYTATTGTGTIRLPVKWASDIKKVEYRLGSTGTYTQLADDDNDNKATISIDDVEAGSYTLFIMFYDVNDELVYSLHSTTLVFSGATTNTWRNEYEYDAAEKAINITTTLIEEYRSKYFFVIPASTETSETGSYYLPYKTLERCIKRIDSLANSTDTYYVFIDGDCVEENQIEINDNISIQLLDPNAGSATVTKNAEFAVNTDLLKLTAASLVIEDIQITGDIDWAGGTLKLKGNTYLSEGIDYNATQLCLEIESFAAKESIKTPIKFKDGLYNDENHTSAESNPYEKGSVIIKDSADTTSGVSAAEIGFFTMDTSVYDWVLGIKETAVTGVFEGVLTNSVAEIISLPLYDTALTLALRLDNAATGTHEHTIPVVNGEYARSANVPFILSASISGDNAPEISNLKFTIYSGDAKVADSTRATGTNPITSTINDLYLGTYKVLAECDVAGMTYSTNFIIKVVKAE